VEVGRSEGKKCGCVDELTNEYQNHGPGGLIGEVGQTHLLDHGNKDLSEHEVDSDNQNGHESFDEGRTASVGKDLRAGLSLSAIT
jgi:hypothetical protein